MSTPTRRQVQELEEQLLDLKSRNQELVDDIAQLGRDGVDRNAIVAAKESEILGLNRKLNSFTTSKIAAITFSPTGHHEVELEGPWLKSDFTKILPAFARALAALRPDEKTQKAYSNLMASMKAERDLDRALSNLPREEREEYARKQREEMAAEAEVEVEEKVAETAPKPATGRPTLVNAQKKVQPKQGDNK